MVTPHPPQVLRHGPRWAESLLARVRSSLAYIRQSPNAALLGAGLVLPNLLSLATLGNFIDVGLPPRTSSILLYATLAMCARRIPFAITAAAFVAIFAFDVVWTLSVFFGMRPHDLVAAVDQARRVHFLSSPLYLSLICVAAVTTLSALYLLSHRAKLARGNIAILLSAAFALTAADYVSNADPHYNFGAMFRPKESVVSATNASGFNRVAGVNGRNVILVIVESLGNLLDEKARARIVEPIYQRSITDRYKVTSGRIVYYGSTTSAEMRELCDTRLPYDEFTANSGFSCLPERLHMRGYTTTAVHGFYSGMFRRGQWYPRIGFDNMEFGEALMPLVKRRCGMAFRGACDADLPPLIVKAVDTHRPNFIYWLTLNTHIPVAPGEAHTNFACESDDHGFGLARVCRMAELWHDVFAAVAQLALDPAIGPAEILLVGDHAPPLWSKKGREEFEAGKVPWYRLTPRDRIPTTTADNVASRPLIP
jgi:hypothetical protein